MHARLFAIALLTIGFGNSAWSQSTPSHGGHGGTSGGAEGSGCINAKISRYTPEHLATVKPGSEFSFAVSGSNGPGHIHVSIKQQPVAVQIEDKDTFYLVKGKLPDDLKNTVVRISVKAKAKVSKCDADGGWLLKIAE
ncbi:hypothetical protein QLH52_16770 [Methylomonas sp. OY6]|uniref:Uncharacterized protein n=1 Tax=Methylomonas defluvii TaxID=3045149 RepID=A0ABU4UJR9_9GAMM|nr:MULTISPECIES: hypothetical protein [unclassified Methylomonas]MDX8128954.1 hypothetical protein [Methylomonas sp. OY6]PKD39095.1 hypothetical protein CWO84_18845 [Methylomonas sp. Kb3]